MKAFGYDCYVATAGYGKEILYQLMNKEEGPVANINIPYLNQSDTVIAVKNYSENEGMLDVLKEAGVVKQIVGYVQSGFVEIPLVEIDKNKLLNV